MAYIEAKTVRGIREFNRRRSVVVESTGKVSVYFLENHETYVEIDVGPWSYQIPWKALDMARQQKVRKDV